MKKRTLAFLVMCIVLGASLLVGIFSKPPQTWTWISGSDVRGQQGTYGTKGVAAASNVPGARWGSHSWTGLDDTLWLFGGRGYCDMPFTGRLNDLWKFDGTYWTWVSGSTTTNLEGTYGAKGVPAVSNTPGGRYKGRTWTDSYGNFWLFGGTGHDGVSGLSVGELNDLWRFNSNTLEWTWVSGSNVMEQSGTYGTKGAAAASNVPGARAGSYSWIDSDDNLWFFGGWAFDSVGSNDRINDLWMYNIASGWWTWVSGSNTVGQLGTYGEKGIAAASNVPGARSGGASWIDSDDNLWLFGGYGSNNVTGMEGELNDLWKFDGTYWTWVSGSHLKNRYGNYGEKGVAVASNVPGARTVAGYWTDSDGNFWLFGGPGMDKTTYGYLNDLWKFDGTYWTWVSGDYSVDQPGIYGQKGLPATSNTPGGRFGGTSFTDSNDNLWLFGGTGYDSAGGGIGELNDLWKFNNKFLMDF